MTASTEGAVYPALPAQPYEWPYDGSFTAATTS